MQEKYRIGNAQTIGSYQIQSNYFSTISGDFALAALADGTIDHINGRRCAVLAVKACMREFCRRPAYMEPPSFFDTVSVSILKEMRDTIYRGKTPNLSLSLVYINEGELYYFTVGNNRIFLYDGREFRLLKEKNGRTAFGRYMTVGLVSCGVHEALNEKELVSYLVRGPHPFEKAQQMLRGVNEKNRKRAGNATVVLVEDGL